MTPEQIEGYKEAASKWNFPVILAGFFTVVAIFTIVLMFRLKKQQKSLQINEKVYSSNIATSNPENEMLDISSK